MGTSSVGGAAQLRAARADLEVLSLRGNIDTPAAQARERGHHRRRRERRRRHRSESGFTRSSWPSAGLVGWDVSATSAARSTRAIRTGPGTRGTRLAGSSRERPCSRAALEPILDEAPPPA